MPEMNFNERRNVPPPPPPAGSNSASAFTEVTIRTMASDLESLGAGSGGQSQKVSIPVHAEPPDISPTPNFEGTAIPPVRRGAYVVPPKSTVGRFKSLWWVINITVLGIILFLVGYYILP